MSRLVFFKLSRCRLGKLLVLFLLSCPNAFAQLQIAEASDVQDCQYLDQIEGSSGYGKNSNWQTLAKYSVFDRAEKLAATHVVWVSFNPVGGFNGIAVAKAYRCDQIISNAGQWQMRP